jgi:hypothetical protein
VLCFLCHVDSLTNSNSLNGSGDSYEEIEFIEFWRKMADTELAVRGLPSGYTDGVTGQVISYCNWRRDIEIDILNFFHR